MKKVESGFVRSFLFSDLWLFIYVYYKTYSILLSVLLFFLSLCYPFGK